MEEDILNIINNSLQFAEEMLMEHQEFYPFGVKIDIDGELIFVAYKDEETDRPKSEKIIEELRGVFHDEFLSQRIRSYGITSDVKVLIDEVVGKSDAILIDIIHLEQNEISKYYFPYSIDKSSNVFFGDSFGIRKDKKPNH